MPDLTFICLNPVAFSQDNCMQTCKTWNVFVQHTAQHVARQASWTGSRSDLGILTYQLNLIQMIMCPILMQQLA
eukprot:1137557-Pelagomonas_calceolata.AAC.2